ncbi:aromatic acid exporter family protein [Streptomyces virginiae]|uniref:aromatic acid exporter family protein n=1 Tax=Streptomyces virginiae TaxID=1961 RepID=UPI002DBD2408|nr:aromatic acid exporter family protein [Streptomyces sp. CMAA1738]MEC4572578.1 aromatic acid exporter family protein [Streptomyces sp. CMAA1738]
MAVRKGRAALGRARDAVAAAAASTIRGVREPGPERDELLLGAKSVGAAVVAWVVARHLLPVAVATFAPLTALLALQVTVYRSVRDCVQYGLAVAAGAALAAALAAGAGIHWWSFALLGLLAVGVGRFRPFGGQGSQVAAVGFFAFSSGGGRIDYIGHLAASVLIGAVCGLGAHFLLAPARHTRRRQEAAESICFELSGRMRDLADAFEMREPALEEVRRMRADWRRLATDCDRLHGMVDTEAENAKLNPRSPQVAVPYALPRTRETLTIAQRCLDHLRSITRTLEYALADGHYEALRPAFRSGYGTLLNSAAAVVEEIGQAAATDNGRLQELLGQASGRLGELRPLMLTGTEAESEPLAPTIQGTLLTDASRLVTDIRSNLDAVASV